MGALVLFNVGLISGSIAPSVLNLSFTGLIGVAVGLPLAGVVVGAGLGALAGYLMWKH